jgi:hypothetical protein
MQTRDDGDEGVFKWALAWFRQNRVEFSKPPDDWIPDEDAAARRKRLERLN